VEWRLTIATVDAMWTPLLTQEGKVEVETCRWRRPSPSTISLVLNCNTSVEDRAVIRLNNGSGDFIRTDSISKLGHTDVGMYVQCKTMATKVAAAL